MGPGEVPSAARSNKRTVPAARMGKIFRFLGLTLTSGSPVSLRGGVGIRFLPHSDYPMLFDAVQPTARMFRRNVAWAFCPWILTDETPSPHRIDRRIPCEFSLNRIYRMNRIWRKRRILSILSSCQNSSSRRPKALSAASAAKSERSLDRLFPFLKLNTIGHPEGGRLLRRFEDYRQGKQTGSGIPHDVLAAHTANRGAF